MKHLFSVKDIKVALNFGDQEFQVGRLVMHERTIYFEYDSRFIERGIEISPLCLPLQSGLKSFDRSLFEGLPGLFNDSLPDGWGRLLFDRFARDQGILPTDVTPLGRLAHVGSRALGALTFEPDYSAEELSDGINLDDLAAQAQSVLDGEANDVLAKLLALNGSTAGARPKALIGINDARDRIVHGLHDLPNGYTPWIVKFPNSQDKADAGAIEYVYALMAQEAGINVPDVHLFPAQKGAGYFAIKRFDRDGHKHCHMHTACGLLHSDFRMPSLDYTDLLALTFKLTRDVREVKKMYRLAVFNVLSHNRDDHAKNFSYLMTADGQWTLSPAYDLTFSSGPGGEQSTMIMGEGRNPGIKHLLSLAEAAGIEKSHADEIINATKLSLSKWPELAKRYGVDDENIVLIQNKFNSLIED